MKLPNLLALPPTILALIAAAEPQWPHNLPSHLKYFPEEEARVKRGLEAQERLQRNEKPVGVKKMSAVDEGEMFMLDDWIFAGDLERRKSEEGFRNVTMQKRETDFNAPLRPHIETDDFARFRVRDILLKRDFKCPTGTSDCSSIGAPNSCCGTGQTCVNIQDTGFGAVACCGKGQSCQGSIRCDTANGYTSCPNSSNGGCCLPGYSCQDVGCVISGTSITYVQPSTSSAASSTSVIVVPTTTTSSTSTPSTSYTCSTGWFSCAASLGGGCCQNGRTCATGASCLGSETPTSTSASTTAAPSAPIRPTGSSVPPNPSPSFPGESACPAGFYACQAYYPSGCCRIGRDCQTTGSCILATPSSTIVNLNGVTIVVPSGVGAATTAASQGGSCPSAWYSCPASRGGNCCPQGFECGEQCSATSGTSVTGKVAPSQATIPGVWSVWGLMVSGVAAGIAMVVL